MNCPDVTLRCIKSHLSHVVSLITCNVFFSFVFITVLHPLSVFTVYMYTFVTRYIKYQSIKAKRYPIHLLKRNYREVGE